MIEESTTFDDGIVSIYNLVDDSEGDGGKPSPSLILYAQFYFEDRIFGMGRQYAAKGVNEQIDRMVRCWLDRNVKIRQYAVIDDDQYIITNVEPKTNEDGLKVMDLTLQRMDDQYDIGT